jgi:hypothetical protein
MRSVNNIKEEEMKEVMNAAERVVILERMRQASATFYRMAVRIGNHPFIEFTGLMNEYTKACERAHAEGIDFTQCNVHSGKELPLKGYEVAYINEKLGCIFTGRVLLSNTPPAKKKERA